LSDPGQASAPVEDLEDLYENAPCGYVSIAPDGRIVKLNRTLGLGQLLCSHSMDDLKLHNAEATAKAWGFVRLSEIVYLGGLNPSEMGNLEEVLALSDREKDMLTDWAQAGEINPDSGSVGVPRGRGMFLFKIGKKAGVPFSLELTPIETESKIHDTNAAWDDSRAAMRGTSGAVIDVGNPAM